MIRLIGVELRRLAARRITLVGMLGLLLVSGVLLIGVWHNARPQSAAEQQQARTTFEDQHRRWKADYADQLKDCRQAYESTPDPKPSVEEFCQFAEPKLSDYLKPEVAFAETAPGLVLPGSYLLAFVAFLIGASFVGAEFSSGSIGNWLTFEPRRLRVYGSKLIGAGLGLVPAAVAVLAILLGGAYLIIDRLGSTAGTSGKVWSDLTGSAGRAVLATVIAAALGGVVALLLRHTAAAIGFVLAYGILIEGVLAGFVEKAQPWLLILNFEAFIDHDATYHENKCASSAGGYQCDLIEKTLTFEHSAWYLGALTAAVILFGALVFHRRDIHG